MKRNLLQGNYLITMLKNDSEIPSKFALNQMKQNMHYRWIFYVDSLPLLEKKYFKVENLKELTACVMSLIYFYASNKEKSVFWALKSGPHFDIKNRSIYTDSILTLIMDSFIENHEKPSSSIS